MKKHDIQQRSDEWFHLRKGKITGTGLKAIMGTKYAKENYFYQLLGERLTVGIDDEFENPMERGNRLEPDGIAAFELETGKKVESIGLLEDQDNPSIANSPDGLIGDDEAIELKCLGGKNHVKLWFEDAVLDDHYWQVIQYFVVNPKLKTLYYVGYNPDIPVHPLHIVVVKRGDVQERIDEARESQEAFIAEVEDKLKEIIKL